MVSLLLMATGMTVLPNFCLRGGFVSGEVSLSELKAFPYPLQVVGRMGEGRLIQPEEVKDGDGAGIKLGKFGDAECLVRVDMKKK